MTTTINISLPQAMYLTAKKTVSKRGYTSFSELVREALRFVLYPRLTENGFTPEFENEVLRIANNPKEPLKRWDGKTPFSKFVLENSPQ